MMHEKVGSTTTSSFPPVASTPVSPHSTKRDSSRGTEPTTQIEILDRTPTENSPSALFCAGDQKVHQEQGQLELDLEQVDHVQQELVHRELEQVHQEDGIQPHYDELVAVIPDPVAVKQASDMLSSTPQSSVPSTPIGSIITPPYSSTHNKSPPLFENEPPNIRFGKKRSFGARRRGVPSALDIDALNRERQFSGPFSANPLLRSHGDMGNKSAPLAAMAKPTEAGKELTPKEPATVQCVIKTPPKVTLPLISELMTGAFLSPSRSTAPVSVGSPLACTPTPWASEKSKLGREQPPTYNSPKRPRLDSDWMVKNARKERFLKLCSEAWDLLCGDDI